METASPSPSDARWRRNYWAVFPSLMVVSMGLMAFLPTLPLYVEQRFGITDPVELRFWAGAAFAGAPFAAAVLGPVWGVVADRFGRKPMAVRALLGITVCTALMPLAGRPEYLVLLRVVQGSLAGYVAPAMSLVTADAPPGRQGRTLASLQVGLALGLLLGPVFGAEVTLALGDRQAVFWIASALSFLAALPVVFLAREDRSRLQQPGGSRSERSILREIGSLVRSPLILLLFLCIFGMRFGQQMVEAFMALWVRELGALSWFVGDGRTAEQAIERTIAFSFSILAVAQILVTPIWGRLADRFGPLRCLAWLALGLGAVLIGMGIWRDITGFLVLRAAAALFMAGGMTLAYLAVGKRVGPERRSLAFACAQSSIQFGLSLGPILGAVLSGWVGLAGLFLVSGGILLTVGFGMFALRRLPIPTHPDS